MMARLEKNLSMINLPSRGNFTIPYTKTLIRISSEADGEILPRTYSYYQNINAHFRESEIKILGGVKNLGPCIWTLEKDSEIIQFEGPIFSDHSLANSTAECFYFDPFKANILWCNDDTHLYKYDFDNNILTPVVDITPFKFLGNFALRQWHSAYYMQTHNATVFRVIEDGPWPKIGTIVYDTQIGWNLDCFYDLMSIPTETDPNKKGILDESQLDKSGDWLLIKENLGSGDDNIIHNLKTHEKRVILDANGAVGHSDNGFDYVVGADNFQQLATWQVSMFDINREPQRRVVYESSWDDQVLHVSHCNATYTSPDRQWVLGSGQCSDLIKIPLDGSKDIQKIAPKLTVETGYDYYPKASLDRYGTYAFWTAFVNGRFDIFMVRI
jgi:hypothetical protein